jgi:ABC-type lipoprotein export system ATPase subunit
MNKKDLLNSITFGQRVAEEEGDFLATYFVETDQWKRLYSGEVDIVYGPKGSGKSALYPVCL